MTTVLVLVKLFEHCYGFFRDTSNTQTTGQIIESASPRNGQGRVSFSQVTTQTVIREAASAPKAGIP